MPPTRAATIAPMRTDQDPNRQPDPEAVWRGILMGTDPRYRSSRALYKHFPGEPRCKMCAVPFEGPFAPSCPLAPSPQHATAPESSTAQVWR